MKAWKGLSTPCPSEAPASERPGGLPEVSHLHEAEAHGQEEPDPEEEEGEERDGHPRDRPRAVEEVGRAEHGPGQRGADGRENVGLGLCAHSVSWGIGPPSSGRAIIDQAGARRRATLPAARREAHEAQGLDDGGGRRGGGGARPPGRGAGRAAPLEEGDDADERAGDGDRPPPPAPHLDDHHVVERVPRHAAGPLHPRRRHRRRRGCAHRALPRERGGRPEGPRGGPRRGPRRRPVAPGDAARRGLPRSSRGSTRRGRPSTSRFTTGPGRSSGSPSTACWASTPRTRPSPRSRSASTRRRPRGRRCARPRSSPC